MDKILFIIYVFVAFSLMFLYEKIYPYTEDETLDCSSREQRRIYNSMMAICVAFWPIPILIYIIKLVIDFLNWISQKKNESE